MLSQELMQDFDEFLNIDGFFEPNNDQSREDEWAIPHPGPGSHHEEDDFLNDTAFPDEENAEHPHAAHLSSTKEPLKSPQKVQIPALKDPSYRHATSDDHSFNYHSSEDQNSHVDMLDDGAWLDLDDLGELPPSPSLSHPSTISPTATSSSPCSIPASPMVIETPRSRGKRRLSEQVATDYSQGDDDEEGDNDDDDNEGEGIEYVKQEESTVGEFILTEEATNEFDLSNFMGNEHDNGLLSSPSKYSFAGGLWEHQSHLLLPSPLSITPTEKGKNNVADGSATPHAASVSDQDIPDMVNLFSSLYSPSQHRPESSTVNNTAPLSILVPTPHMYNNMFSAATAAAAAAFAGVSATPSPNTFDYFTPPAFTQNRYLDGQPHPSIFLNPDTLSPATKASLFAGHAQAQAKAQVHAQVAAAMVMANSMNNLRKLNPATYGVPIAPMIANDKAPLKPKVAAISVATTAGSKPKLAAIDTSGGITVRVTGATGKATTAKVPVMTPDMSDYKLVQTFHSFCDPVTKLLHLPQFHRLLLAHHQVKDDGSHHQITSASGEPIIPQETQTFFNLLDVNGVGYIDLEKFMNSFQICNRCTEAKRRAQSAQSVSQDLSTGITQTQLDRPHPLVDNVAPVIVRVVPTTYEGSKVKSCEHYQWTWCEGFEKTGNEKCKGTNRHDKCPKYLANCTLWKHKLPPKNRKPKMLENLDSPSKKFKHFA